MKEKLYNLLRKRFELPHAPFLTRIVKSFSPTERLLFLICTLLLVFGVASLLMKVNNFFLVTVPARGGALTEGILGSPRFINPLLALSDADRDLVALVYSGLLKATPDGELIPDLAERFTISEDSLTYTFYLREDARFHDGTRVTADDVLFTIQKAQDTALKSPKRANWEGVTATKVGDRELTLSLKQPYAPFLENATMGILPKHLFKDAEAEQFPFSPYNIEAIGSGPYEIAKIKRNNSGLPMYYELKAFDEYTLGTPYIKRLVIRFYSNEKGILDALARHEIESATTLTPEAARTVRTSGLRTERTPLPRIFGVFFNQNQATVLSEKAVREALNLATNKDRLVGVVLHGYGIPIDNPVPPILLDGIESTATTSEARVVEAQKLLDQAKWKVNAETGIRERTKGKETQTLSFSLITSNISELRESAELLKEMWKAVGADVKVQIFESGDLNQNVIRPRKYDALLFGEVIGRDLDLFAFWHSSQRNDPGLNIAMYTNSKVDKLLEENRRTQNEEDRIENYRTVISEIARDVPAIFLYSPDFIYVVPEQVKGFTLKRVTIPSERFLSVHEWYINTEKVWNIFRKSEIENTAEEGGA